MKHFLTLAAAFLTCAFTATAAFAHAFLDRAVPGVGATVNGSPSELQLTFTQNIVPAFSGVTLAAAGGAAVPVGKPALDPSNQSTLHVPLGHALKPGTYVVSWHVVSVDTHPTSGTYKFTVAP
ncbi:copper homeostasis periplasmic binding protein CopC [Methyloferula stellata]|uniref:copper homeostasis periplasmic binding protein CopC n=1 Tax=Methyloferula stellata TaxID=876270 RepID=UPI000382D2DF|nr:copper homeostasis periplasmic binding protein CopC [Methyloferula stellata]